jgi:DNA-binding response OmpR family regulator
VDDEADIRSIIGMALSPDFEVVHANNGLDAMLKVPKYQPDLLIVDIMMPLMNGLELAEKVRETAGFQHTPIIALSALDSKEDIKKGYGSGANLYLTKPFEPERLRKNVQMTLERFEPRPKTLTLEEIGDRERKQADQLKRALERRPKPRALQEDQQFESRDSEIAPDPIVPPSASTSSSGAFRKEVYNPKVMQTFAEREKERKLHEDVEKARAELDRMVHTHQEKLSSVRPRVLVVDDEVDFLDYIRLALEEDYEVVTAHDGFDALNKIPEIEPDIFVVDGMMPKMSGYQLIDALNTAHDTRGKPIIFVSAKGGQRDQKLVFAKGVTHYLVKPFDTKLLLEALGEVCRDPGFHVAEKSKTIDVILISEGKRREKDDINEERKRRWASYNSIEKFLKENKESDPFTKK